MKEKLLLLLILLISFNYSFSQVQVEIENLSVCEIKGTYDNHFFATETGAISIKVKPNVAVISTFKGTSNLNTNELIFQIYQGNDLQEKKSVDYTLPHANSVFEYVHMLNGRLFVFYTAYENLHECLWVQEFNPETGSTIGSEKLLISVGERLVSNPRSVLAGLYLSVHNDQGKFEFIMSNNNKTIIFKYQYKKEKIDNGSYSRYGIVAVDENLNQLWSNSDFSLPYPSKLLSVSDFIVSNQGKGYLLAKKMKDAPVTGGKSTKDPENYQVSIFTLSKDEKIKETNFDLKNHLIQSVLFAETNDGNILCSGYYYAPNTRKYTKGIFISTFLSKNDKFENPAFFDFSLEFIKKYTSLKGGKYDKAYDKGEFGFQFLRMYQIKKTSDGGILAIGGVKYPVNSATVGGPTHSMTAGGSMWQPSGITPAGYSFSWGNQSYQNHTIKEDDMIITKFNSDGELEWMQKIAKRTYSYSKIVLSDDLLYVLFNDDLANLKLPENKAPKALDVSSGNLVVHTVDLKTGEKKIVVIADVKNINNIGIKFEDRRTIVNKLTKLGNEITFICQLKIDSGVEQFFRFSFEE